MQYIFLRIVIIIFISAIYSSFDLLFFLSVEGRLLYRRVWRSSGCCTRWRSSAPPSRPSGTAAGRGTAGPSSPTSGSTSLGCPATPRSLTTHSGTPDEAIAKCSEFRFQSSFLSYSELSDTKNFMELAMLFKYLNCMSRLRVDQVVVRPLILGPLAITVPESSEKINRE